MAEIENKLKELKILQLAYKMPFSLKDGGAYSVYTSAKSLLTQSDCELKILAMNTRKDWFPEDDIPKGFASKTNFEWVEVDTRLRPLRMIRNFFSNRSDFTERFYCEEYKTKVIETLLNESFDVIQLEHVYLCSYLDDIRKVFDGQIVLRAQNVEYKLWETYRSESKNIFLKFYLKSAVRKLRLFEENAIANVDGVISLTIQDRIIFESISRLRPCEVIPIGFDDRTLDDYSSQKQFEGEPIVYHLGSMDWRPNIQGVNWFLREVLPILIAKCPEIKVKLAGKKMPKEFYKVQSENVVVDGEVDCAVSYVEDKSILIVPLLSGSGIRVKIIEAMAMGKSIVSTSLGAQGINYTDGKNILIADSPESFASAIIKSYDSLKLRKELSKNAKEFAINEFDLVQLGKRKMNFYHKLINIRNT